MIQTNKILLITNYRPDKQFSMIKFGELMLSSINEFTNLEVQEIFPKSIFTKIFKQKKFKKIASYIDKYLLFPQFLKNHFENSDKQFDLIHIVDHSNSIYFPELKKISSATRMLTCHDLIAIRTALKEFPEAPTTSCTGSFLQSKIKESLTTTDYFICDSTQTLDDLNRLVPKSNSCSEVIHLGTQLRNGLPQINVNSNFDFESMNFILHVGSAAWYKNRRLLFNSFRYVCNSLYYQNLSLVLVGPCPQENELDEELSQWMEINKSKITVLNCISEDYLSRLYRNAIALVFPSYIEGFGWPPLEAAIHGCRVITTPTGAIKDILGENALYINAKEQNSLNSAIINCLKSESSKKPAVFIPTNKDCIQKYQEVYQRLILCRREKNRIKEKNAFA